MARGWRGRRASSASLASSIVPHGNNLEKNAAIHQIGAELVEAGKDYDESAAAAEELRRARGLHVVHSTNDRDVIAGAATMTLEIVDQAPDLDAVGRCRRWQLAGGGRADGGAGAACLAPR